MGILDILGLGADQPGVDLGDIAPPMLPAAPVSAPSRDAPNILGIELSVQGEEPIARDVGQLESACFLLHLLQICSHLTTEFVQSHRLIPLRYFGGILYGNIIS